MFDFLKKRKKSEQSEAATEAFLKIADWISNCNPEVHGVLVYCLDEQMAYRTQYADRYQLRGIDVNTCDADTLCWIAIVDELEASGDCVEVDHAVELEDFLCVVSQLNAAKQLDLSSLHLEESGDVYQWCGDCNQYLQKNDMLFCGIDIDSDGIDLILVTTAEYDKISALAQQAGHRIVPAETL